MNLLAIECSTEYLSLALEAGGRQFEYHEHAGQRHAERIYGEIDRLLKQAGLKMADVQGIAYGRGPGSFTGLRIACGVTQGLAYAIGAPVQGVVTLEALAEEAYQACGAERVVACTDARMGEVYHGAYQRRSFDKCGGTDDESPAWTAICAPGVYPPSKVPVMAPDLPGFDSAAGWIGAGNGFAVYGEALRQRYAQLQSVHSQFMPMARAELALARAALLAGNGLPAHEALPLYIRDNVALKKGQQ